MMVSKSSQIYLDYIGGYPIKNFDKDLKSSIFVNNFGFDNVAIRKIENNEFDMILLKWTMGTVK